MNTFQSTKSKWFEFLTMTCFAATPMISPKSALKTPESIHSKDLSPVTIYAPVSTEVRGAVRSPVPAIDLRISVSACTLRSL